MQLSEDSVDVFLLTAKCFIMFDGLNEIAGSQRDHIIPDIADFLDTYPHHKYVITSRPQDELWQTIPQGAIETRLAIRPIEPEDAIKYLCIHLGEWLGRFSYGELSGRIRELLQLPLVLWMFKEEVLRTKKELDANSILINEANLRATRLTPQNKGEMYQNFAEFVLEREKQKGSLAAKTRPTVKQSILSELALSMQRQHTLVFVRQDVVASFATSLKRLQNETSPSLLLDEIQLNGLLVGEDELKFMHQTFQEFFAATALSHSHFANIEKEYAADPWWTETIVFLAGVCDPERFDKLVTAIIDTNPLLAVRCILEGIPSTQGRKTVQKKLESMLSSENWLDRQKAAEFLGMIGDSSVVPMLSRLIDDPASNVRWQVASSLREISGPKAEAALIKALKDTGWAIRARAAEALGRMKAVAAIPYLRPLFVSDMPRERSDATYALVLMKASPETEGVADLLRDEDTRVSGAASLAIEIGNSTNPIEILISRIHSEDSFIREKAAYLLTRFNSVESIPSIRKLLQDPNGDVVIIAIQSLAELNAIEYLNDVLSLFNHPVPFVRTIAAFSCQLFGSKSAVPALIPLLKDPDSEVRMATVRTLGVLGVPSVVPHVIPLLQDSRSDVRLHAAMTLGALGNIDVIPHLESAEEDSSFEVRDSAEASIIAIKKRQAFRV
jgi:HEAT repeat protein